MKCFFRTAGYFFAVFVIFITNSFGTFANTQENTIDKIKRQGNITMSTSADFEPFDYLESNHVVGIDIDIAKKIANKLGVQLKVNDVSLDSLIFELKNHSCDFIAAGMSYDEERAKNVDFSNPYFSASQVMLVLKGSNIKSFEDLAGKKVGVQLGTTGDTFCTSSKAIGTVVRLSKPIDAVVDLINNQIDAVVIDDFTADKLVAANSDKIYKLDKKLTDENYSFAVLKGETELLGVINDVLSELKSSGELNNIINNYYTTEKASSNKFSEYSYYILDGFKNTIIMTLSAAVIGIVIGLFIASIKVLSNSNKKLKFLGWVANIYTTVIRGTPALIQLFIMYYVILSAFGTSKIIAAILAFGINSGAYVAEHIRGGILSVDKGQMEAGLSLGLSQNYTMIKIIIPQALKNILPSLASEAITLLKETSVAGFIGVMDLSRAGDKIRSLSYEPLLPLAIVAGIYLILVVGFTSLLSKYERRIHNNDTH
ncbi:MAG: arginine/lysine/histidine transport system permease protein [Eubacteriales bacterium SKADARSKE-1]|nr:arginine/lysine/histidine transport system permease protein [Eubacteriales bacterium SKADARSKE-1]